MHRTLERGSCFALVVMCSLLGQRVFAQGVSTITVGNGDVAGLVSAINSLNAAGGGRIELAANGQYSFAGAADWWYGPNALPAVTSAIVIEGNGSTLQRLATAPPFRFVYLAGGFSTVRAGNLTLRNLTLTGGLAQGGNGGSGQGGGGGAGLGGAIYNQGSISLSMSRSRRTSPGAATADAAAAERPAAGACPVTAAVPPVACSRMPRAAGLPLSRDAHVFQLYARLWPRWTR